MLGFRVLGRIKNESRKNQDPTVQLRFPSRFGFALKGFLLQEVMGQRI